MEKDVDRSESLMCTLGGIIQIFEAIRFAERFKIMGENEGDVIF